MRLAIYQNLVPSGAKRATFEVISRLAASHRVDFYGYSTEDASERHSLLNLVSNVYLAQPPSSILHKLSFAPLISSQRAIGSQINQANYDAVLFDHCMYTHTPLAITTVKAPTLYYMQDPRRIGYENVIYQTALNSISRIKRPVWKKRQAQLKKLDATAAKAADSVLCNSLYSRKQIKSAYNTDATVCYLGVDEVFRRDKSVKKKNQVIVVGTVHPTKAQFDAVSIVAKIPIKHRPALGLIYERFDADYLTKIKALAQELVVELRCYESVSDKQLCKLYNESLVTLCLAHGEPFGFTPLESMACGTPVIAVKEGGFLETVEPGQNGVLVSRKVTDIAAAVLDVISGRYNFEQTSIDIHERWSWDKTAENYEQAIIELLHA